MLRAIRRNVFETNSSSTHSISIYKYKPRKDMPIPLNSTVIVEGTIEADFIKDEMGKLNYIVVILASIYECNDDGIDSFEELIDKKQFVWLRELIKAQCNTNIVYDSNRNYFPYFTTTYDENENIEHILGCDINNEEEFKDRVKEIIFNAEYVIEDREDEY